MNSNIYSLFLIPVIAFGQSWQFLGDGVVSCKERAAIISDDLDQISYVSLDTHDKKWQVKTTFPPDSSPILAGNAILMLGDHFSTIYAFSKITGKRLWSKSVSTSSFVSDGNYFYVLGAHPCKVQALDPASGAVVWSLRLPRHQQNYFAFLAVHKGLLFTGDLVIDISKRAIVHRWLAESFFVSSIDFADDGSIFLEGRWGNMGWSVIYDRDFKRIRKLQVGKGDVGYVSSNGVQMVALLEYGDSYGIETTLAAFTRKGEKLWSIVWPARSMGLTITGRDVLIIEPRIGSGEFRLASRELSTGKLNWATRTGPFFGSPVLCGHTAYLTEGDHVDSFDARTGVEIVGAKEPSLQLMRHQQRAKDCVKCDPAPMGKTSN